MTNIRATCPTCGEVSLTSSDIALQLHPTEPQGSYKFECPFCDSVVERSADPRIIRLLISGGVIPERGLEGGPPPLTYDDLLDFHVRLRDDEAIWESLTRTG